jgi:transcription-repair coupling factor (superfamily II helicase)
METLPFVESLRKGVREVSLSGLWGSSKAYMLALLRAEIAGPCLVVTPSQKRAEEIAEDLGLFLGAAARQSVCLYSQWNIDPYEHVSPLREITAERLSVLDKLLNHEKIIVVAPVEALVQRVMPRTVLEAHTIYVGVGEELERQSLLATLVDTGYKHTPLVENRGEFSVRGGIVDVFPAFDNDPIRIEFFGDEVESLRTFDVTTQRSLEQLDLINLLPAREIILSGKTCAAAHDRLADRLAETGASYNALKTLHGYLDDKIFFPGAEWYAPDFYGELESVFEYLAAETVVVLEETQEIEATARTFQSTIAKRAHTAQERGYPLPPPEMLYLAPETLKARFQDYQRIKLQLLDVAKPALASRTELARLGYYEVPTKSVDWDYTIAPAAPGRESQEQHIRSSAQRIREWLEDGQQVVIVSYTSSQARRVGDILQEHGVPVRIAAEMPDDRGGEPQSSVSPFFRGEAEPGTAVIMVGTLNCGFGFPAQQLMVVNEDELLAKRTIRRRHQYRRPSKLLTTLGELEPQDYVVHVDHGIGVYLGLKKVAVQQVAMECLHLEYKGGDKLYVPVDRLDLIQKYKGADQRRPRIDKLGGTNWARVKERVKASVEKMAQELLDTFAARQAMTAAQFTVEEHLYREFEAAFEYEETPDQAKAIEAVIHDMRQPRPMDRLICGDVGYGKTEVAMRAAFLAVLNGKQVAVLVPTTLLAQQHYDTFTARFAPYPVAIGILSRFVPKKDQQAIVEDIKAGAVDIVIGTHRLLQKDIAFKDLGLVIIDEEQRFGVAHKEKIRRMRTLVDVLTLTATPIPRTLHMSLMGVRDLSIIETPPEGRLAVRTHVTRFDDEVVYDAITSELDRSGQVFFIHNRVQTIDGIALRISRLVPQANVAIAHGQMKGRELEKIMLKFLHKEIDVLISTTIIESGLDIPSVNTIIINRAHTFGLSQLYQLRGRIGRAKTRAYAYLLIPDEELLTPDAQKRLRVIQELTELGAGFRLASHDLEIRGAGSLLGAEQTGHIAALGFDMYCNIIEQTVREMRGLPPAQESHPQIDMQVSAHFPETYIPDMKQRLEMYKRLMSSKDFTELFDVEEEVRDRYGKLPPEAQNIVSLAELTLLAAQLRVQQIQATDGLVKVVFDEQAPVTDDRLRVMLKHSEKTVRKAAERTLVVQAKRLRPTEKIKRVKNILQSLHGPDMMESSTRTGGT